MRRILLLIIAVLTVQPAWSQEGKQRLSWEVNAGVGLLIYQSVYSLENSFGVEAAVRSRLAGPFDWHAGMRLGMGPVLPEAFGRVVLVRKSGAWEPDIGIETGLTARGRFPEGTGLLAETQEAMNRNLGVAYMSVHAAPLSFRIREHWRLSFLELDIGTHFVHFGRTLRGQLTLISISRKL